jgi:hypothetical protein
MAHAADFRMREGFCVPIRDGNAVATLSISGERPDLGPGVRTALHVMSLWTYHRFSAISRPPPTTKKLLTPREREALRWVSAGKSDWDPQYQRAHRAFSRRERRAQAQGSEPVGRRGRSGETRRDFNHQLTS